MQEVQQQEDEPAQPQKKQSCRQKDKTPSTFTQPVFSGKSQGEGRSEGTSSRGPCYNCGEEGHFSCNCPNRTTNPPLQTQQQTPPQIKFQPRAQSQGPAPKVAPAGQVTNKQETICFQCCGKGHLAHRCTTTIQQEQGKIRFACYRCRGGGHSIKTCATAPTLKSIAPTGSSAE